MADKFIDYQTKVCSDWLNKVDWAVFDSLGLPKTPDEARENIGAVDQAPRDGTLYGRIDGVWSRVADVVSHPTLAGRDQLDQHPQAAVTGLELRLAAIEGVNTAQDAEIALKVEEAPNDGTGYIRQSLGWAPLGAVTAPPHNELTGRDVANAHPTSAITGLDATLALKLEDAPSDGETYARNNGSWAAIAQPDVGFEAGTRLLFQQSVPPVGWVRDATFDECALRVMGSAAVSSGGSIGFGTLFGRTATDTHTLTTAEIPAHAHSLSSVSAASNGAHSHTPSGGAKFATAIEASGNAGYDTTGTTWAKSNWNSTTNSTGAHTHTLTGTMGSIGSGGSHSHGLDMRLKFVDVILAVKQ